MTAPSHYSLKVQGMLADARDLIAEVNAELADDSARQYKKAFERMRARALLPETIALNRNSFYFYRAAWIHHFSQEAQAIISQVEAVIHTEDAEFLGNWLAKLTNAVDNLKQYKPDPRRENLASGVIGKWVTGAHIRRDAGQKETKNSNRARLTGLPDDWRTQMFYGLTLQSQYRDVVAVLSATGARPAEFKTGIKVCLGEDQWLHFCIKGAKCHGGKFGQLERSFSVRPDRSELEYLLARLSENQNQILVTADPGALSDKVRQLSLKVFPKLHKNVSAYTFRHQISADLKASGFVGDEVSKALGHCVDATKSYYGSARSARSQGGFRDVDASREVKVLTPSKILKLKQAQKSQVDRQRGG